MAGWTNWRLIADKNTRYIGQFDWIGPAIYELSITGPRGGNRIVKYLGETHNEKTRLNTYARNGSHLWQFIDEELELNSLLWYRSLRMANKEEAVLRQNKLLSLYDYPWNKQLNCWWK